MIRDAMWLLSISVVVLILAGLTCSPVLADDAADAALKALEEAEEAAQEETAPPQEKATPQKQEKAPPKKNIEQGMTYEQCVSLINKQQYEAASKCLPAFAEGGDPRAQVKLGALYSLGRGFPKDLAMGVYWFRRAADQGYADGQFMLAQRYYYGEGVEKNYGEAARLWSLAVQQGHQRAMAQLAFLYLLGKGVEKDIAKAHELLKGSDPSYAVANEAYSYIYSNGLGVPVDLAMAYYYADLAVKSGRDPNYYLSKRDEIERKMTAQDMKRAMEMIGK